MSGTAEPQLEGRAFGPFEYAVELEEIREYSRAVDELDAIHHERDAARAAGFRDVVAPPMYAAVYSREAVADVLLDVDLGVWMATILHTAQEFAWAEPVCAGDVISTTVTVKETRKRPSRTVFVLASDSTNQDGEEVVHGVWTHTLRGL